LEHLARHLCLSTKELFMSYVTAVGFGSSHASQAQTRGSSSHGLAGLVFGVMRPAQAFFGVTLFTLLALGSFFALAVFGIFARITQVWDIAISCGGMLRYRRQYAPDRQMGQHRRVIVASAAV